MSIGWLLLLVNGYHGNLRFPLDKTYHGCPRNPPNNSLQVWAADKAEVIAKFEDEHLQT
jgi:hypothetical protein